MTQTRTFEIFCAVPPGLEPVLAGEMSELGWSGLRPEPGGVCFDGNWADVWRANLWLRGTSRVLARIDRFRVVHLSQLDKRAHKVAWADVLRPDVPVRVEASCRKSKIYHAGAAVQRVEAALRDALGVEISAEAAVTVRVRIDDNVCTLSVDTSGELLHRRGFKAEVNKAPMRETLAALFLRASGHDGTQPLLDPMCGSGTFIIEAAEMAAGLAPGRSRAFAFEQFKTFDAAAWTALKSQSTPAEPTANLTGSDRDAGAIRISRANAQRAGVAAWTQFSEADARTLSPPPGEPGLVILNPPYGARIGNKKAMLALYAAFGANMLRQFRGWRVALVTSDPALARATRLPFREPGRPVDHGGIKIRLYQTGVLG